MDVLALWRRLGRYPGGRRVFSILFARTAPYFASIRPDVLDVRPSHARVRVPLRRRVTNHLGTLHAIALCNGLEAAMGVMAEATCPPELRWIPKGMEVRYTAKAGTDVVCSADVPETPWQPGDLPVAVQGLGTDGTIVIEGTIHLWISARKPRPAA